MPNKPKHAHSYTGKPHYRCNKGRMTPLEQAKALWPKSKRPLREALMFAQFLTGQPLKQPGNARLLRVLGETLDQAPFFRVLVEERLLEELHRLQRDSFSKDCICHETVIGKVCPIHRAPYGVDLTHGKD